MMKTIDLFSGAGGLSYGFEMTGKFKIVAAAEINANARRTYKKNIIDDDRFEFIENVVDCDFSKLKERLGNDIEVVIGGPPCQGFSNANRQKNHLISMNNGLVKEYFRAIKEIQPQAFVMENVSMLSSDVHRFYESTRDNEEIDTLIEQGFDIPKREDRLILSKRDYDGIEMENLPFDDLERFTLPAKLSHLLSVLQKNIGNERRLPNFLKKNSKEIIKLIDDYTSVNDRFLNDRLMKIKRSVEKGATYEAVDELGYVVGLQKLLESISEIKDNGLIGRYEYSEGEGLYFKVNSYSVIDYVNAILGEQYIQKGTNVNAEWFGVPQERRRYIIIGVRKDIYEKIGREIKSLEAPKELLVNTVEDALDDLAVYEAGYDISEGEYDYKEQKITRSYAAMMREGSTAVHNHITTKTTKKALDRFKKIKQGKNFHSLDREDKDTYSKPERTQNTIYLRLDPKRPCGTVVNVRKSMWIHPDLDRAITVREAARLQSFPDKFVFEGSKDSQYQQIGNAVPPLMAKGIANYLAEYLENKK